MTAPHDSIATVYSLAEARARKAQRTAPLVPRPGLVRRVAVRLIWWAATGEAPRWERESTGTLN